MKVVDIVSKVKEGYFSSPIVVYASNVDGFNIRLNSTRNNKTIFVTHMRTGERKLYKSFDYISDDITRMGFNFFSVFKGTSEEFEEFLKLESTRAGEVNL